jgi:RNA polymerase sigma factor (sigma-70 family)
MNCIPQATISPNSASKEKKQTKIMPFHSEEQIISGCLKNDRAAQRALYDLFKSKMYTLAYRITNNFEDAGDVLQEGFLEVFENLKTFKGNSRLGTWIHTIIARKALKKIKESVKFDDLTNNFSNEILDWGNEIDIQLLDTAIRELPDGYRAVFTLYEIEGFNHAEIADMLDISVNTSKSQLYKAKRVLIHKLGGA